MDHERVSRNVDEGRQTCAMAESDCGSPMSLKRPNVGYAMRTDDGSAKLFHGAHGAPYALSDTLVKNQLGQSTASAFQCNIASKAYWLLRPNQSVMLKSFW